MGPLNRAVGVAACCALLQVCPVTAQAQAPAAADKEDDVPHRMVRVRRAAHALFASGVVFTALERGHRREVCAAGVCAARRRAGYSWAAAASYAGASVGYFWSIRGSRGERLSIGMVDGGVSARVSW